MDFVIVILWILTFTAGNVTIAGYYIRWNPLLDCLFCNYLNMHWFTDWIWVGSRDAYSKKLDKEKALLDEVIKRKKDSKK
jgi:hypothetical protein